MSDVIHGELNTHSCPRCGEAAYLAGDNEDEAFWYCGAENCSWHAVGPHEGEEDDCPHCGSVDNHHAEAPDVRARYVLEAIIADRMDGGGIYHQLSKRTYAEHLLRAVDAYLEALP